MRKLLAYLFIVSFTFARYLSNQDQDSLQDWFNGDGYAESLWGAYYAATPTEVMYWNGRAEACYSAATTTHSYSDSMDLGDSLQDLCNTCYYLGLQEVNPGQRAYWFGLADGFCQEASSAWGY